MRRVVWISLVVVAGCGSGSGSTIALQACPGGSAGVQPPGPRPAGRTVLHGLIKLPGAATANDPGFEQRADVSRPFSVPARAQRNQTLVLTLRDVGRRRQACADDHPLSGCATLDWFTEDDGTRRAFDNTLALSVRSGERTFALRAAGTLENVAAPPRCLETSRYTAIGGVARRWVAPLPAPIARSGTVRLRLVLTKFAPPTVLIGYAVRVERSS